MKKIILAGTAASAILAMNVAGASDACDKLSLGGFHIGLGVVVDFDKYDLDAVGGEQKVDDGILGSAVIQVANVGGVGAGNAIGGSIHLTNATAAQKAYSQELVGDLTKILQGVVGAKKNGTTTGAFGCFDPAGAPNANPTVQFINNGQVITYVARTDASRSVNVRKLTSYSNRSTVVGGQVNLSYYFDWNNFICGVDLGLAFTGKGSKDLKLDKAITVTRDEPNMKLYYDLTDAAISDRAGNVAEYVNIARITLEGTSAADRIDLVVGKNIALVDDRNFADNDTFFKRLKELNPDLMLSSTKIADAAKLERDVFSPTLAFVIGATFDGWLIGGRLGLNYMSGKVNLYNNGTKLEDKKYRSLAPLVGLQIMKQVDNNIHVYATCDYMFHTKSKDLGAVAASKLKRSSIRASLGVTYRVAGFGS